MYMTTLDEPTVAKLKKQFDGQIILPHEPAYGEARKVWNGLIDRYPALIVRPQHAQDVITAVNFAREHQLLLAVRGGGHNVAGHGTNDGGLIVDLSAMKGIHVDPVAGIVRAAGGVTWGELDAACQVYGLATPGGVYSKTGIAGLTLGGGFGWLRNKFGLSCDNLIAADVVTADGRLVHVSAQDNADLMWGLRGGGGNFGIVTRFEYKLHPVGPDVMFVFVLHDGKRAEDMQRALRFYRDFSQTAPDEVSNLMALGQVPPEEHFPEALHKTPFILFGALYAGPVDEGKRILQPMIDFAQPLLDFSGVTCYTDAQKMFDADYPEGLRYYWKSLNLNSLDDSAIERIVNHARKQVSPFSTTDLWHIGGEVARGSADSSAFYGRHAAFLLSPEANWIDPTDDEANIAWLRAFIDDMAPYSDGSRYLNFAGLLEEGDQLMRKGFGPNYDQLAALKRKYDPHNLFKLNQNVQPDDPTRD